MKMNKLYSFSTANRLIYGLKSIEKLGKVVANFGEKVLLVTGQNSLKKAGITSHLEKILADASVDSILYDRVTPEPALKLVAKALDLIHSEECDCVAGIGGGSVLDVAKAVAGLANSPATVYEHFEGRKIDTIGIPFIAVPTTSGTGAEVTPNSVLSDKENQIKKSIRNPSFMADTVIADPELTVSLPPAATAYSGMDALVQGIEAYTSKNANYMTDALSFKGIELIGLNIKKAYENGNNLEAREAMLYGSMLIGIAFSNCRLGAVHGMAHPVGAFYKAPHGLVCGTLLPTVMQFNKNTVQEKYYKISQILGIASVEDSKSRGIDKLILYVEDLLKDLNIPTSLRELGLKENDIPELARLSMPSGSLKANPRQVTYEDAVAMFKNHL